MNVGHVWAPAKEIAPVMVPPAKGSLVASATVMLAVPSKLTPLIARAVVSLVAVAALPVVLIGQVPLVPVPFKGAFPSSAVWVAVLTGRSAAFSALITSPVLSANAARSLWKRCAIGS